jgi:hypothetical protein
LARKTFCPTFQNFKDFGKYLTSLKIFFDYFDLGQRHLILVEATTMPMLIRTTSLASQLDLASANASYLVTVNAFNGSSAFTASPFVFAIDTSFQRTQVAFANHKGQT